MNKLVLATVASVLLATPAYAQTCNIKGNVSTRGERIYHVPGQKYYDETSIQSSHGERWFCTEAEARAAGWRRSKV
ncbi:sunset domain-containing protein [Devosia faecipullorum]|uniref:sunset domain-containing protein n=1 Tax=Devosia faecipullorum TaxID=2755039 RepID=UPI001E321027|nr:hypothetical protein [Devosia faecipullorum]